MGHPVRGHSTSQYLAMPPQISQTCTLQDSVVFLLVGVRLLAVVQVEGDEVGVMRGPAWTQFKSIIMSFTIIHNSSILCRQCECKLGEECTCIV